MEIGEKEKSTRNYLLLGFVVLCVFTATRQCTTLSPIITTSLLITRKGRMKALLAVFALCVVCALAGNVVDLTPDNFDSVIDGSKAAFVEFFAPYVFSPIKMVKDNSNIIICI